MKKSRLLMFFIISAMFAVLSSCVSHQQEDLFAEVKNIPAKYYSNYSFDPDSSLISRVQDTPDFILDYLKNMDNVDYYSSYTPTQEEMKIIESYLDLLPPLNKKIMKDKLLGIYFVSNFIGSGMADYAVDDDRNIYTLLFINQDTLKVRMNEWMDYRENTCFIEENDAIRIEVECGNEYLGFLYILLHESTHIVDYITSITPYTEWTSSQIRKEKINMNNKFIKGIWTDYRNQTETFTKEFMGNVTFYALNDGPRLIKSDAEEIYNGLLETPFVSLYASQNWAEDLAELETWYHYTEIMGQPYEIVLYENNEIKKIYKPMENELVRERFSLLEHLYRE
ncbi:MAG: hypothetical protein KAR21_16575 [Spirochaetales bacterium]|nr:hypothetical protein [Spirochaetales bacterium]